MCATRTEELHLRVLPIVVLWCLLALALEVAGTFQASPRLWGVHHYAFLPGWWLAIGALGALGLTAWGWSAWRDPRAHALDPATHLPSKPPAPRVLLLVPVLVSAAFLFVLGRERLHFLGDGYARLHTLTEGGALWPLEPLGIAVPALLHRLLSFLDPAALLAGLSVACGLVYLAFAYVLAGTAGGDRLGKGIVFGLLALAGITRLFYGSVETYPLLAAVVAAYLVLGVRSLTTGAHPAPAIVLGILAFFVHSIAIVLVPSMIVLALAGSRLRGTPRNRALVLAAIPLIALVAFDLLLRFGGWNLPALVRSYADNMLPAGAPASSRFPYGLFSGGHLRDLLQEELLLGPFAGLFALLLVAARRRPAPAVRFLLWAGIPWWIVAFLLNRTLGGPRQWSFVAAGAVPFLMLAGLVLADQARTGFRSRWAGAAIGAILGVSFFHTLPWVVLGTDRDRSISHVAGLYGPGSPQSRYARAAAFDALGTWYLDRSEIDNAEMAFKEAVTADTTSTHAAGHLASLYLAAGRPPEAAALLAWAAGHTPEREFLHYELGNAYLALGLRDSAEAAYKRALARNPDFLHAYVRLSGVALDRGRLDDAEQALNEAKARFPDDPAVQANLGRLAQERGDTSAALVLYREALDRNPGDADTAFNIGLVLMNRREWKDAAGYFSLVVDRRPRDMEGWVNLGICRERGADIQGALGAYRQAVAANPARPEGVLNLVRLQIATGDTTAARDNLRGYAARDSTSQYGVLARNLLRSLERPSGG